MINSIFSGFYVKVEEYDKIFSCGEDKEAVERDGRPTEER